MCTVTFIPTSSGFYLTSNRDELTSRPTSPPAEYNGLIFPRDELAGGTWIAVSPVGKAACLLNGGGERHVRQQSYARSRGLILLDYFSYHDALEFYENISLKNIEPFTLLTLEYEPGVMQAFYEFVWDGHHFHKRKLTHDACQIWSSVSLYAPEVRVARHRLFEKWMEDNKAIEDRNILDFHKRGHGLKAHEDIVMKGSGDLMTLSISQLQVEQEHVRFYYLDRVEKKDYNVEIKA